MCASGSVVEHLLAKEGVAGSIPVSRLEKRTIPNRYRSFFRALAGLESSISTLRSGPRSPRSPGPRAPSRASFICSGSLDFTGFPLFYVVADLHPPAPSRFIVSAIMLFLINSVSPLLWVDCKYIPKLCSDYCVRGIPWYSTAECHRRLVWKHTFFSFCECF